MIIIDADLLAEIRLLPCCWCGARPPSEAAHVFARGMGGGHRLDVRINLAPLCTLCHRCSHDGHEPTREQLLRIVAARECVSVEWVEEEIYRMRRLRP